MSLLSACQANNYDMANSILKSGTYIIEEVDAKGFTSLHHAGRLRGAY